MLFGQSISNAALQKALSATWERAQLIGTNIANEDTPGYKAKRLRFEAALNNELNNVRNAKSGAERQRGVRQIENVRPEIFEDSSTIGRADGNNVDIVNEQIEFSRVMLQYQVLSQKVSSYYTNLKYAISGGR